MYRDGDLRLNMITMLKANDAIWAKDPVIIDLIGTTGADKTTFVSTLWTNCLLLIIQRRIYFHK